MLDSMAFELAYRQYAGRLTGLSRKITNGSADAEDVAQDAWIEAWKARCTIDAQGMWKWLCRVLRRLWWHRLNRAGKKRDGFTVPLETAFDEPSPNDQHGDAQRTQIADAAKTLGGAQRDAVHMALNGFDGADIAQARGTSLSAATLSIRLAVKRLRQRWGLE